jgi:hypothetical protein
MTKRNISKRVLFTVIISIILSGIALTPLQAANSSDFKIDLAKFTQETQKIAQDADKMELIWWIPTNFWEESFKNDPSISRNEAKEIIDTFSEYVVVAVVDGTIDDYGNISYRSYSRIINSLHILDKNKKKYEPLPSHKISSEANELLAAFKPIMANMLGNMGQNLHIFLFPKRDARGIIIDNPKAEGSFSVVLGAKEYKWKLPLISLYPVMPCEKCHEHCSVAWNFCPWCGMKLSK